MRKKLISKTYLREVEKHDLKLLFEDDCYYSIKKIKEIKNPFVLTTGLCLIDSGYYIVEILPKNENYSIRIFFDNNKKLLQYYIDISLENGLDEETKIPYYDDLFLDIIITDEQINVVDEDELMDAYNKKIISMEEVNLAYNVKDELLKQIEENSNKYLNMDFRDLLY